MFLDDLFYREGPPYILQCDNGKEFKNKNLYSVANNRGVKIIHGRVSHPQSNGQVERLNQTICNIFSASLCGKPKKWVEILRNFKSLF